MGTLYLVSTPIGNLEDLTSRAARILGEVDAVLAEDTRRTATLLRHLGHRTPLVSLHRHNEAARTAEALERLSTGASLALVSDAGTPLVSDPGERLVRGALEAGHPVVPVPGPSAILHALVGSGLPAVPFAFLGFVPRKGAERRALIDRVAASAETVVLFEAPGRLGALLEALRDGCGGDRPAAVAREMTKLHEEFRRGTLRELAAYYAEGDAPRGEVTVVVAPAPPAATEVDRADVARDEASALLREGLAPSRVARELARRLALSRNEAYALVQSLAHADGPAVATRPDPMPPSEPRKE